MRLFSAWRAREDEQSGTAALPLLEVEGCPICCFVAHAEERFFFWYVNEYYQDGNVLFAFGKSLGMCPPHMRQLLSGAHTDVVTALLKSAVSTAARLLTGNDPIQPCPACENAAWATRHAADMVARGLRDIAAAEAWGRSGRVCLPHASLLLPTPSVADLLRRRLASDPSDENVALVAGTDRDAGVRGRLLQALPEEPETEGVRISALRRLRRDFSIEACPACLAAGRSERRYLVWLASWAPERQSAPDEGGRSLCGRHLHDLAQLDSPAAERVASVERSHWRERVTSVSNGGSPARPNVVSALLARLTGRRRADEPPRAPARIGCAACYAAEKVRARQAALLVAAVTDDSVAHSYARSHGLCVRCVRGMPTGGESELLIRVLRSRLAVVAWELEESERKRSWTFRWERQGTETTAWYRTPAILDGRVYGGGPAAPLGRRRESAS